MTQRTADAQAIINRYAKWSAGAGLIPLPILDVALVTGLDVKMLADLARLYHVPFREDLAKSVAGALIGAVSPPILSYGALGLLAPVLRMLHGVATVAAVIAVPLLNAATTRALGRVFVQHFESGGTFLDFDPDSVREHFRREFQGARGKTSVTA